MENTEKTTNKTLSIATYVADLWEHVCPVVRVTGPAEQAGANIIRGNEWQDGQLHIYPERVSEADLVLIQRNFPDQSDAYEAVIQQARANNKLVVFELDDLLPELPEQHPDFYHYLTSRSAILRAVMEADAIISSTPALCEYLRPFNPNIWVRRNYLDDGLWKLVPPRRNQEPPVTIGYLGGHSHAYDLEIVAPALARMLEKFGEQINIKFWGVAPPPEIRDHANVQWTDVGLVSYAQFAEYFVTQECDLFIAPLQDNVFNRCKSALKFLEYSAMGAPGVYSRITSYESIVTHGENGFLASNDDEWEQYLTELIEDPDLRYRLGANAQATVQSEWLLSDHLDKWSNTYAEILILSKQPKKNIVDIQVLNKVLAWERDLEKRSVWLHQQLGAANEQLETFKHQRNKRAQKIAETQQQLEEARQQIVREQEHFAEAQKHFAEERKIFNASRENLEGQLRERGQQLEDLKIKTGQQIGDLKIKTGQQSQQIEELKVKTGQQIEELKVKTGRQIEDLQKTVEEKEQIATQMHNTAMHFNRMYDEIYNSRSWRLMRMIQSLRLKMIPRGGKIERLLKIMIRGPIMLLRGGPQAALDYARQTWHAAAVAPPPQQVQPAPQQLTPAISVDDGVKCAFPAIGIILIKSETGPDEADVQAWVQNQTLVNAAQIAVWDQTAERAWLMERPNTTWETPDSQTLLSQLDVRYICFASPDLLAQDETFLEFNLVALETESLAFTVNLRGHAVWALNHIRQGKLPGDQDNPLLRLVARKDCISKDLALDLSTRLDDRMGKPGFDGKVILHATNQKDEDNSLPFKLAISPGISTLFERNIVVRAQDQPFPASVPQKLYKVDTVMPVQKLPSDLPTVIIVMPFLAVGGAEQIVLKNLQHSQEYVRFVIFTFEEPAPELGTLDHAYRQVSPYLYSLPYFLHYNLNWSFLAYVIKRFDPNAIYIPNGTSWIYDALGHIKRQYPHIRISNQVYDADVGWINRYDMSLVAHLDAHLAPNSKIRQAYIREGARPEDTYIIENGIEPEELDPEAYSPKDIRRIKQKLGLPKGKKVVTFASRIHFQKRPMDYVELARRFSSDHEIVFLMVGDGPMATTVDQQVQKIGLKNFYRQPFYRPINDILAISDVLVLPSEFEGMPMIITEALTMGKPFVATDVGNNKEVLERVNGGIVVSQIGDIPQLMNAVRQMLDAPPDPVRLRQQACENWDIKIISQQFRDAILGPQNA